MRPLVPAVLLAPLLLAACAAGDTRRDHVSADAQCIHHLYDYPQRQMPFQNAAASCSQGHTLDLTGDAYYQQLATSLAVPFTAKDKGRPITLTGSRLSQPSDELPPPQLSLH
jgi:hypothetical protein